MKSSSSPFPRLVLVIIMCLLVVFLFSGRSVVHVSNRCHSASPKSGRLDLSRCALSTSSLLIRALAPIDVSQIHTLDLGSNDLVDLSDDACSRFEGLTTLFLTGNLFSTVPSCLRTLKRLTRLSLKNNQLATVNGRDLPPNLIHLILTENHIRSVSNLGILRSMKKLMLSGNEISSLSEVLAPACGQEKTDECARMTELRLLRVARNKIVSLSRQDETELAQHEKLAWLSVAGNPVGMRKTQPFADLSNQVDCREAPVLGRGASGVVRKCQWNGKAVAVKTFKKVSSDGSRDDEIAALSFLPSFDSIIRPLGALQSQHSSDMESVVFPFISGRPLAGPATIQTVVDDTFEDSPDVPYSQRVRIIAAVGNAVVAVHAIGVVHGDIYAHNVMLGTSSFDTGQSLARGFLTDFGASYFLHDALSSAMKSELLVVERRAFAVFVEDVMTRLRSGGERSAQEELGTERFAELRSIRTALRATRLSSAEFESIVGRLNRL